MIYLDNAATTFPKPPCMAQEVLRCMREYCGNPGRSGHSLSIKAAEKIYECRELLSSFFGASAPEKVVFTSNTTQAINTALQTLYEKNTHVLISNMEHNSVLRPATELQKKGEITYSIFDVLNSAPDTLRILEQKKRPDTKMLILQHASNVCGQVFPIREIGNFCHKHGITFIVDAAQSAGVLPIHIQLDHIDALCIPAHKGLYGPQGLGAVIFGEKSPKRPFIIGGNGVDSLSPDMHLTLPEGLEGGTLPTPLIAGLFASMQWIKSVGIAKIEKRETALAKMLAERLLSIKGSVLYGPKIPVTGILLYNNRFKNPSALSAALDAQNICTRGGFHCAPLAHNALKTGKNGAIRFSFGYFNTIKDVDAAYSVVRDFCK